MTAAIDTPAVAADPTMNRALARIDAAVEDLRNLRALVLDRPDIAVSVVQDLTQERVNRVLVRVSRYNTKGTTVPEYIAGLAADAVRHGAAARPHHNDKYGGIDADFGVFRLHIYADLADVGEVSTRTDQVTVTDFQPHPALAAFAKEASA